LLDGGRRGSGSLIDHEGGHLIEKGAEKLMGFGREGGLSEGVVHELHPAIASGLIDMEGKMAGAKAGMAAFGDVSLRAAKAVDQEIAKALFGSFAFVRGIHGTKDVVVADLAIESGNEAGKTVFADNGIDIFFVH
jgi:hypothetical protein